MKICGCNIVRSVHVSLVLLFAAVASPVEAQFDDRFQDRAMAHVRYLSQLGNRVTGSHGERRAIRYIQKQFKKMGLVVEIESFEFRSFALEKAILSTGGQDVHVVRLVFDPYSGVNRIRGEVAFLTPDLVDDGAAFSKLELRDKLLITQAPVNVYRVNSKRPRAVAFVSASDFERLRQLKPADATIEITGRETRVRSANVIASLLPTVAASNSEVIISAHLDSVRTPGANDNASGIAALLELARYYRHLTAPPRFRLKFIALGAEEVGMLGSKAYLSTHLDELKRCSLVFNMDSIGGAGKMHAEMLDGVQGIAGKAVNQIPRNLTDKALSDMDSKWMYIPGVPGPASDVPPWLQSALTSAASDLGIDFAPSRDMGSDHGIFAQAGIVATNVEVSGGKLHTSEDVPERVAPAAMERSAQLVVRVVASLPQTE